MQELRKAIEALFNTHPGVAASIAGHNQHAKRFLANNGAHIGWRDEAKTRQNLYVERDRVNLGRLKDITHTIYEARSFATSMPNHNLFHKDSFAKDKDLIAFAITDLWQAVRVVFEVAGDGR